MKRFTWWRMEQDAHHLSRALCGAFCSILHHVKRFLSQPPYIVYYKGWFVQKLLCKIVICQWDRKDNYYILFKEFIMGFIVKSMFQHKSTYSNVINAKCNEFEPSLLLWNNFYKKSAYIFNVANLPKINQGDWCLQSDHFWTYDEKISRRCFTTSLRKWIFLGIIIKLFSCRFAAAVMTRIGLHVRPQ